MAATVLIRRLTAAGPTATDITSTTTRSATADDPAAGSSNPIPIPATGSNYGFWVTTRLDATVTPAGTINNLRWFSDGTNSHGTGVTCVGQEATSYVVAAGTVGTSGTLLAIGVHAGITAAPVDVFTLTAAAPKSLAGSITTPTTGQFGSRFVYQHAVASTTAPGTKTAETWSWRFDET